MKADALILFREIAKAYRPMWEEPRRVFDHESPRSIIERIGMNPKRAMRLLDKWSDRGWYDFGVSLDLGWMTPEGLRRPEANG